MSKTLVIPEDLLTKDDFMVTCGLEIDMEKAELSIGEFTGIASAFGNEDSGGDVIEQGAFAKSLAEFAKLGTMPGMFFNHDKFEVQVGEWLSLVETSRGLVVRGLLWVEGNIHGRKPNAVSEQIRNMFLSKGPKGLSIGGQIDRSDPNNVQFKEIGPKGAKRLIRILKAIILREISPVSFPANDKARVTMVKSEDLTIRQAEQALLDMGFSLKDCKTILSKGYSAIERDADNVTTRDASEAFETGRIIAKLKHINNTLESYHKE